MVTLSVHVSHINFQFFSLISPIPISPRKSHIFLCASSKSIVDATSLSFLSLFISKYYRERKWNCEREREREMEEKSFLYCYLSRRIEFLRMSEICIFFFGECIEEFYERCAWFNQENYRNHIRTALKVKVARYVKLLKMI